MKFPKPKAFQDVATTAKDLAILADKFEDVPAALVTIAKDLYGAVLHRDVTFLTQAITDLRKLNSDLGSDAQDAGPAFDQVCTDLQVVIDDLTP